MNKITQLRTALNELPHGAIKTLIALCTNSKNKPLSRGTIMNFKNGKNSSFETILAVEKGLSQFNQQYDNNKE